MKLSIGAQLRIKNAYCKWLYSHESGVYYLDGHPPALTKKVANDILEWVAAHHGEIPSEWPPVEGEGHPIAFTSGEREVLAQAYKMYKNSTGLKGPYELIETHTPSVYKRVSIGDIFKWMDAHGGLVPSTWPPPAYVFNKDDIYQIQMAIDYLALRRDIPSAWREAKNHIHYHTAGVSRADAHAILVWAFEHDCCAPERWPMDSPAAPAAEYQTQKAKGLKALVQYDSRAAEPIWMGPAASATCEKGGKRQPIAGEMQMLREDGLFARPCPTAPRHGFVESRVVHSGEELYQVVQETLTADPQGEIILMTPISAHSSAILSPGRLTIGAGNDGATAGHASLMLPYVTKEETIFSAGLLEAAEIHNAAYIEVVYDAMDNRSPRLVQLRDGVQLPESPDYVPRTTKVKRVLKAQGDLLEWESTIKGCAGEDGLVVAHAGADLASHYAVHAIAAGIPVVCSRAVKVGDTVKASGKVPHPSIKRIRAGVAHAWAELGNPKRGTVQDRLKWAALALVCGARNAGVWAGRADYALGCAVGAGLRAALAACLAEARYAKNPYDSGDEDEESESKPSRSECWEEGLLPHSGREWAELISLFGDPSRWNGHGFGGKAWKGIAMAAAKLEMAISAGKPSEVVQALNVLCDVCHNNGWAFNKFGDTAWLSWTPEELVLMAAPAFWEWYAVRGETRRFKANGELAEQIAAAQAAAHAKAVEWAKNKPIAEKAKADLGEISSLPDALAYLATIKDKVVKVQVRSHGPHAGTVRLQVRFNAENWYEWDGQGECPKGEAVCPSMAETDQKYVEVIL